MLLISMCNNYNTKQSKVNHRQHKYLSHYHHHRRHPRTLQYADPSRT